jgi:hypothetical protein
LESLSNLATSSLLTGELGEWNKPLLSFAGVRHLGRSPLKQANNQHDYGNHQ